MNVVVEGIYEKGIVKLKTEVEAPNNTEVLVIFRDKANKEKFLKSAGSRKNIDIGIFNDILKSRENLGEKYDGVR
jgi:predicted DNA-binding antitoxin AbrB/MazE fold protein